MPLSERGQMNRFEFIRNLAIGLAGIAAGGRVLSATVEKAEKPVLVLGEVPVAGIDYYNGNELLAQMKEGDMLTLVREPDNPYDENAVVVLYSRKKIGYLPQAENYTISTLMDQQVRVNACITEINPEAGPWEQVWVEVRMGQ